MTLQICRQLIAAAALFLSFSTNAYATRPVLTPMPKTATKITCAEWAKSQDEDAIYMWGTQESGEHPKELALLRLTQTCLGRRAPDIVSFGSSAGFDKTYCSKHTAAKICKERPASASQKTKAQMVLGKSDVYIGCVFSIAIPLMHNGVAQQDSSAFAFKSCDKYSHGLEETEIEGAGDYVNLVLDKISAK